MLVEYKLILMPATNQQEVLKSVSSFLIKNNIPYMITGAWSVIYYGRPRASHDIDFVVELKENDIPRVLKALKKMSFEYLIQPESIKNAIKENDMFNIIHLPTTLKLDFWLLKNEEFDNSRFKRRRRIKLFGQYTYIATAEDTILKKLEWYKTSKLEKHLIDAAFVYQIQKNNLDKSYTIKWSKKLKLSVWLKELSKIELEKYI